MKRRAEAGFTIIELVVVIALLGLLAAVALPRFVNLRGSAQTASFNGVRGAFASSVALTHAQWLAQNGGATINMDGGVTLAMTAGGWPSMVAVGQTTGALLYPMLMQDPMPAGWGSSNPTATTMQFSDASSPANTFTYDSATGQVATP